MAEAQAVGGPGWAQSRGGPTYVRGINLLGGDPPAFRFATYLPACNHRPCTH